MPPVPITTVPLDTAEVRRRHAVAGLTQAELAVAAGVHPKHLNRVLAGTRGSVPLVRRLADTLGCAFTDLVVTEVTT